jgi:hypothetical protein
MFNAIPIKIPIKLSSTLKFICKHKRPWIAKAILSKKSNTIGSQTQLQTIIHSHKRHWHKHRTSSGTELNTQIQIHTTTHTWVLTKVSKTYEGEKTTMWFEGKWVQLEYIILSKVNQALKEKDHRFSLICGRKTKYKYKQYCEKLR